MVGLGDLRERLVRPRGQVTLRLSECCAVLELCVLTAAPQARVFTDKYSCFLSRRVDAAVVALWRGDGRWFRAVPRVADGEHGAAVQQRRAQGRHHPAAQ